jgi:hypothetical protein
VSQEHACSMMKVSWVQAAAAQSFVPTTAPSSSRNVQWNHDPFAFRSGTADR